MALLRQDLGELGVVADNVFEDFGRYFAVGVLKLFGGADIGMGSPHHCFGPSLVNI